MQFEAKYNCFDKTLNQIAFHEMSKFEYNFAFWSQWGNSTQYQSFVDIPIFALRQKWKKKTRFNANVATISLAAGSSL